MGFHEDAFDATVEIVAAAMEEAEVELTKAGGEQVADFFDAIYKRLRSIANDEENTSSREGSFEVYLDSQEEFRFRLKAANGQTIAVSEGYTTKAACLNGIESVKKNAGTAPVKHL